MPSYTAKGLVINRRNLGENDRILSLFTREYGKLSAVAKGSRRASSSLSGATELFIQSRMLLATGRNLDIITQCEIDHAFYGLREDLQLLARATYFCELLDSFTAERDAASCAELFDLTTAALELLQRSEGNPDGIVHGYELRLLMTQGYAPILDRCAVCGEELASRGAAFSPASGGMLCFADRARTADAVSLSAEAVTALQKLQAGDSQTMLTFDVSQKAATDIARALRWYIRERAERHLKSADFLDQLRASV